MDCLHEDKGIVPETADRIQELVRKFNEEFKAGTSDTGSFMTMDQLEMLMMKLVKDTESEYRKLFDAELQSAGINDMAGEEPEPAEQDHNE